MIDEELRNERRAELFKAIGGCADAYESTEGGIVTAYYCVIEVTAPDGGVYVFGEAGVGAEGERGVPRSRALGLLTYMLEREKAPIYLDEANDE